MRGAPRHGVAQLRQPRVGRVDLGLPRQEAGPCGQDECAVADASPGQKLIGDDRQEEQPDPVGPVHGQARQGVLDGNAGEALDELLAVGINVHTRNRNSFSRPR